MPTTARRMSFFEPSTTCLHALKPSHNSRQNIQGGRPLDCDISVLGETCASSAMTQFPLPVLRMRGRILVHKHAPFMIKSVDNTAAMLCRAKTDLEGRSLASLSLPHSIKLLEACSHVNRVSGYTQRKRAFLIIEDGLLVIVQNENYDARQSSTFLEVLLFRPDADDTKRMQLLIGNDGLLIERAQGQLSPNSSSELRQESSTSTSWASPLPSSPSGSDQAQYKELAITDLHDDDGDDGVDLGLGHLMCSLHH